MVEPVMGLRGHMRSMSSLASTIMPYSPEKDIQYPAPLVSRSQYDEDLAEGLKIPLPPSSACSENGHESPSGMDQKSAHRGLDNPQSLIDQGMKAENTIYPVLDTSGEAGSIAPDGNTGCQDDRHATGPHIFGPLPLEDLVQAIRREYYEEDCLQSVQLQVHELMYTCTLLKHSLLMQSQLYRLMIDQYNLENKESFDVLFKKSLKVQRWPKTLERPQPRAEGYLGKNVQSLVNDDRTHSWIDKLSFENRQTVTSLLREIRTDPSFLSSRLATLSNIQLGALARSDQPRPSTRDSVFQSQSNRMDALTGDWKTQHRVPGSRAGDLAGKNIQETPLSLLLNTVFDQGPEPSWWERQRRFDTWSSACAQIISDGKYGSDELVILVLDEIANSEPWPLALNLESYLMDLIQDGAFLLDTPTSQHVDFTQHQESSSAQAAIEISRFFESALLTFVRIINSEPSQAGMSSSMLDFIRAVLHKVRDPKKRIEVRNFIVSRWYCGSFLPAMLIWPECRGLMMTYHISSIVRQRILKELASRMQRTISDYLSPWKNSTLLGFELTVSIGELLKVFEPKPFEASEHEHSQPFKPEVPNRHYLTLRPEDVLKISETLFPDDEPFQKYNVPMKVNIPSIASSAGSSTLTSGTAERRIGTASSNAPSFGTSMTSNTIHSELPGSSFEDIHGPTGPQPNQSGQHVMASKLNQENFCREVRKLINNLRGMLVGQSTTRRDSDPPLQNQLVHFLVQRDERDLYLVSARDMSLGNLDPEVEQQMRSTFLDNTNDQESVLVEAFERLCQIGRSGPDHDDGPFKDLEEAFAQQISLCQSRYDFQSAHFWWKSLRALREFSHESIRLLVIKMTESAKTKIRCVLSLREEYSSWLFALRARQNRFKGPICDLKTQCEKLRDKMWYLSDVKHSLPYEDALNVARALRSMVGPVPSRQTGVAAWARSRLRSTIAPERAHTQTLEALTADNAHGGPYKMNDRQVERTSRWLTDQSIENFCKGEERIHRFLLEVQKCANKLVGESLLKSPVLWSSALYQHESRKYGIRSYQSMLGGQDDTEKSDIDYAVTPPITNHFSAMFSSISPPYTSSGRVESSELRSNHDQNWGSATPFEFQLASSPREPVRSVPLSGPSMQVWRSSAIIPESMPITLPAHGSFGLPSVSTRPSTKQEFIIRLKETTLSLLLSDLGYTLWSHGSETDRRLSDYRDMKQRFEKTYERGPSSVETRSYSQEAHGDTGVTTGSSDAKNKESVSTERAFRRTADMSYPYSESYDKLLAKFGHSSDPFLKINLLYELTSMVECFLEEVSDSVTRHRASTSSDKHQTVDEQGLPETSNVGKPRTRATRLEEVMANCEDRRRSEMLPSQLTYNQSTYGPRRVPTVSKKHTKSRGIDTVPMLTKILSDSPLRTKTLFRDLQYIAALVPASFLDSTPQGRAFWDVGLAALHMKTNLCKSMIDRADQIIAYHTPRPGHTRTTTTTTSDDKSGAPGSETTAAAEDPTLAQTDLTSAARLYTVPALEGDPTAARELALFYLAHHESVPRVTLPLSRPSEVFKSSLTTSLTSSMVGNPSMDHHHHHHRNIGKGGGGGLGGGVIGSEGRGGVGLQENNNKDKGLDPLTFAVAFHWMELAANGGDRDAKTFLRENGDLGKGL